MTDPNLLYGAEVGL